MALEREEFQDWMRAMREDMREDARALRKEFSAGIGGVHDRLDDLNSRTRKNENQISVLEDRGNRDTTARAQGIGGMAAAAGALLWQWLGGK